MKLCRSQRPDGSVFPAVLTEDHTLLDLSAAGIESLASLLESDQPNDRVQALPTTQLPRFDAGSTPILAPVDHQEVWAAGVTYLRSKTARMEESDFSASAYDRVYEAPRPELFFKSLPEKVVSTGQAVGIRGDASWNVPEPELALVVNSKGRIVAYTIGNDMSSRDIEGENLLYLPQAKVYHRSCALGPWLVTGVTEEKVRSWTIALKIERGGQVVFSGETSIDQIKRPFTELVEYLCRCQEFPHGVVLLTGTGVVPGDGFTLQAGDHIAASISGIGSLRNPVVVV